MCKKVIIFIAVVIINLKSIYANGVFDTHSHFIPKDYVKFLKDNNAELQETFPLPNWTLMEHINFTKKLGIGYSLLSLPAPQPYFSGSEKESIDLIHKLNQQMAKIRNKYPDKIKFLATVPLPNVDKAIEEAIYALDVLKADGIKLASNSYGQYVGDKELDKFMKVLNDRNAVVFIHPHRPEPYSQQIIETTPLAMYEYPAETTRTVVNMISRNILARYPNIKVIVPHCGSFLPLAIARMKAIFPAMKAKGLMNDIDWDKNLSSLYYDLAGQPTVDIIKTMLKITTIDHIFYGSDYPYQPTEVLKRNLENLKNDLKNDKTLSPYIDDILYKNAERVFERKKN